MTYTIESLANAVANDLKETIIENGFDSFKEMKRIYDWNAADIRSEISYTAQDLLNKEYDNDVEEYGDWSLIPIQITNKRLHIMDDDSIESLRERATYAQFKKMVMNHLK